MAEARETATRALMAFNNHDESAISAFNAPNVKYEAPGGVRLEGRDAATGYAMTWLKAFPDISVTTDLQTALGPNVASWVTMRGTHRGVWQGVLPTNRETTIRTVAQHRVENGRIVEDWVMVEALGLFQQLRLVPPTPELLAAGR